MAAVDLSAMQPATRIRYIDGLKVQLNQVHPIRGLVKRVPPSGPAVGHVTREVILTGSTASEGYLPPESVLPLPDKPTLSKADIYMTEWWGTLSVTVRAQEATKNTEGAAIQAFAVALLDLKNKAEFQFERVCVQDGTGVLAIVVQSQSANASVAAGDTTVVIPDHQTARVRKGERIEFWNTRLSTSTKFANPGSQDFYKVTNVARNSPSAGLTTVTLDQPLNFAVTLSPVPASNTNFLQDAGLLICKDECRTTTGGVTFTNEHMGLLAIAGGSANAKPANLYFSVNTTGNDSNRMQPNTSGNDIAPVASTLFNVSSATEPTWQGSFSNAAGGDFAPQTIEDAFTDMASNAAMGREGIRFLVVNPVATAIWRKNKWPEVRVMVTRDQTGGWNTMAGAGSPSSTSNRTYLAYNDLPIAESKMMDVDKCVGVGQFTKYYELAALQEWVVNGMGRHKSFARLTAEDQELYIMEGLGTNVRSVNFLISNMNPVL